MYKQLKSARLPRRGVLLIVVLSLLVLFALIGLTFVVVAGHYSNAARISVLTEQTSEQGPEIVDQSIYVLLRGTNDKNSQLYDDPSSSVCNSLLEDLYSDNYFVAPITNVTDGLDLLYFELQMPAGAKSYLNAYAGCVATVVDGPAAQRSARIAFSQDLGTGQTAFYAERFDSKETGESVAPLVNNQVLVSGKPFSASTSTDANESYDAPDALNPHLAFIPLDAPTTAIIPSFADRLVPLSDINGDMSIDAADRICIDNDRDGILDSGWIDIGLAVKTAADGRRYKPVVAYLCTDLDGRLNLNAHGSLAQLSGTNYSTDPTALWAGNGGASSATGAAFLSRGMGFGPADVNLSGLLSSNTKYQALLQARYGSDNVPGTTGIVEDLWYLSAEGISRNYLGYTPATGPNTTSLGYASPPDVQGRGFVGVDHAGRPISYNMGLSDEISASPYQFCPVVPNGKDRPYTAAELERILRFNDVDRTTLARPVGSA